MRMRSYPPLLLLQVCGCGGRTLLWAAAAAMDDARLRLDEVVLLRHMNKLADAARDHSEQQQQQQQQLVQGRALLLEVYETLLVVSRMTLSCLAADPQSTTRFAVYSQAALSCAVNTMNSYFYASAPQQQQQQQQQEEEEEEEQSGLSLCQSNWHPGGPWCCQQCCRSWSSL